MTDPIKSYIFIWYIDIGDIANGDVPSYMESAKKTLGQEQKLEDMLNGEVIEYFIPCRNILPKLEVLEFNVNSNKSFSKTSESLDLGLSSAKEKISKILNELNLI